MTIDLKVDSVIHAIEPTCLHGQTYYKPRWVELYLGFSVNTAIVVPGPIDIPKLKDAIAQALSGYPLYTGRVEKRDSDDTMEAQWLIRLDNSGATFHIVDCDEETVVPISSVIQAPFKLSRNVDYTQHYSGVSDEPLLRVTVTKFGKVNKTAIGFSLAHVVGDGWMVYAFMRTVSEKYLDLNAPGVDISYQLPAFPDVSPQLVAQIRTPWLEKPYLIGTTPTHLDPTKSTPAVRVDFRLSATQLAALKKGVLARSAAKNDANAARISTQDALVAVIATCITRADCSAPPIRMISTVINHRGVAPLPINAAGNALIQPIAEIGKDEDALDAYALAVAVRQSLLRMRDPDIAAANVVAGGNRFKAAADESHGMDFSPGPGQMFVNSTRPFDWTQAHFGYPGNACFYHTILNAPRYVKIFTPNPAPLPDGSWRSNAGAAEITFYLQPHIIGPFKSVLKERIQELDVAGDIEFIL